MILRRKWMHSTIKINSKPMKFFPNLFFRVSFFPPSLHVSLSLGSPTQFRTSSRMNNVQDMVCSPSHFQSRPFERKVDQTLIHLSYRARRKHIAKRSSAIVMKQNPFYPLFDPHMSSGLGRDRIESRAHGTQRNLSHATMTYETVGLTKIYHDNDVVL